MDRNETPRFLTPGEVDGLLRHARGTVHHDVIYCLVRTGVRAAELAALRWEDVDLDKRVIRVGGRQLQPPRRQERQERQDRQGHEGRRRYLAPRAIPIDDELARIISRQPGGPDFVDPGYGVPRRTRRSLMDRAARRPEFVFAAESGGPRRNGIERGIRRAAELAGIEAAGRTGVGPRMFRHTFAAQLVMNGADTGVLREVLGLARAEHLARYRSLVKDCRGDYRIPRGRPLRAARPEDRAHLDERKRRFVQSCRPRIGIPHELEEVERMIERLEDETRSLESCRRTRKRLTAIVESEMQQGGPDWLKILYEDADGRADYADLVGDVGLAEAADIIRGAQLAREAQAAEDAKLKEALARLDGIGRDLRYWTGRLVSDLGLAIRLFGRVIFRRPVCPAAPGRRLALLLRTPEPAELRRQIEELTELAKHASSARELSAGGDDYTRQVRTCATGPPPPPVGILGRRNSAPKAP